MSFETSRLALIQMAVTAADREGNLSHAEELISEAAASGSQLTLLPECFDLGWCEPSSQTKADSIPEGRACRRMMQAAKKNGIYVCAGITEKFGDQVYNAAVLIDPEGQLLLHHRKTNELEIAKRFYAPGDLLNVVDTDLGVLGLMICADGFAEDLTISRSLGQMGAQIILSPCAWAVPIDHDNKSEPYGDLWRDSYRPVAEEFGCAILGASNVGTVGGGAWKDRPCIGCSLVIGNDGQEVLQGPYGVDAECILYVDWDGVSLRQATPAG